MNSFIVCEIPAEVWHFVYLGQMTFADRVKSLVAVIVIHSKRRVIRQWFENNWWITTRVTKEIVIHGTPCVFDILHALTRSTSQETDETDIDPYPSLVCSGFVYCDILTSHENVLWCHTSFYRDVILTDCSQNVIKGARAFSRRR